MRKVAYLVFYLSAAVLLAGVMMFAITGIASANDDWLTRDKLREAAKDKARTCYMLDTEISSQLYSRDAELYMQRVSDYAMRLAEVYHHYCKR